MATEIARLPIPPIQFGLPQIPQDSYWGSMDNSGPGAVLDCCEAAIVHSIMFATFASTGTVAPFVNQDAMNLYEAWTGYIPGNPSTDLGTNLQIGLNAWASPGITDDVSAVHTILSQVQLPTGDFDSVVQASYLLGPVIVGIRACAEWMDEFLYGVTWDAISGTPATPDSHVFVVIGRNAAGNLLCVTFGGIMELTRAGFNQFTTGAFAVTTADYINTEGVSPLGYTLTQLTQYAAALAA